MYLSEFTLDRKSPSVRQCLQNAQDMHRNVMSGFGDDEGSHMNVLYRLFELKKDIKLYVLSPIIPNWDPIQTNGFHLRESPKDLGFISAQTKVGRVYGFDLLCIPAKKEPREGMNSRRVILKTSDERLQWLTRKAMQNGFSLNWAREDGYQKVMVKRNQESDQAWHSGVRFRGELTVTDVELFVSAFKKGIGAGKVYGFGMLLLFPPQRC